MVEDAELRSLVEGTPGGTVGCDVCGFTDVEVVASRFRLMPVDDAGRPSESSDGLAVVATICPECSAVQLYSHPHLKRLADRQAQ